MSLARFASPTVIPAVTRPALADTIRALQAAYIAFLNGDPAAWRALCSHAVDSTLFDDQGHADRGWPALARRHRWTGAGFAGGAVTFEELARYESDTLAATVWLERARVERRDVPGTVPLDLRATHLFRREPDRWRLVHRHVDRFTTVQGIAAAFPPGALGGVTP